MKLKHQIYFTQQKRNVVGKNNPIQYTDDSVYFLQNDLSTVVLSAVSLTKTGNVFRDKFHVRIYILLP